jgi:hypothetical protein
VSILTGSIWQQEARQRLDEVGMRQQVADLSGDKGADVVRSTRHFLDKLRSPIDDRDDVLEVVTGDDVAGSPSMECLKLRGDEQHGRHDAGIVAGDAYCPRRRHGRGIPPIGESQHAFAGGQHVDDRGAVAPAAEWRVL